MPIVRDDRGPEVNVLMCWPPRFFSRSAGPWWESPRQVSDTGAVWGGWDSPVLHPLQSRARRQGAQTNYCDHRRPRPGRSGWEWTWTGRSCFSLGGRHHMSFNTPRHQGSTGEAVLRAWVKDSNLQNTVMQDIRAETDSWGEPRAGFCVSWKSGLFSILFKNKKKTPYYLSPLWKPPIYSRD